ncbi:hypothetical protein AT268_31625 [Bacillus cereus]|uniref:Uncharacterized protein n=1 Tax=Bacillus cereus TaxID=1396 RepID=A0A9X0MJY0_BACCE|nr:hypothetical protein [Bacillus cereus]KXY51055.1 hypothetical protein AT268_31625 [Bacillus cereus]
MSNKYVISHNGKFYAGVENNKAKFGSKEDAIEFNDFQKVSEEVVSLEKDGYLYCYIKRK